MSDWRFSKAMVRRACLVLVGTGRILLGAQAAFASDEHLAGSVLEIHHRDKQFVDPASQKANAMDANPVYILRKDATVSLRLLDPNPLLFAYGVEVKESEGEQHKIATQFAGSLGDVLKLFKNLNASGGPGQPLIVENLDLSELQRDLGQLHDDLVAIPSRIDQSVVGEVKQMRTDVAGWNAEGLAKRLAMNLALLDEVLDRCQRGLPLRTPGGTVSCMSAFDAVTEQAAQNAARLAAGKPAQTEPADANSDRHAPAERVPPAQPPASPRAGGPPRPGTVPLGGSGATEGSAQDGAAIPSQTVAGAPAVLTQTIHGFVTLVAARQSRVESGLRDLLDFVADAAEVDEPRPLKCQDQQNCVYKLNDQKVTVKIAKSTRYEAYLTDVAKRAREKGAGEYSFSFKAYSPVSISVAPAFVVLFVDNPTYKATKKGEEYVIESEGNGQTSTFNLAAMLTITPRSWAEPTFGGQFQLGVSPTKGKVGFYLGAGIHVQEVFTFGAGVALQQVTRLADGLSVGQTIANPEALKTESRYRTGLYLHFTVNIK